MLYGFTTTKLKSYVKQAHKAGDKYATKQIYKDYKKSGGKLPLKKIISSK